MLKIAHKMWWGRTAVTLSGLTLLAGLATPPQAVAQTMLIDGSTPVVGAAMERKTGPSVDQLMNRSVVGTDGSKIGTVTDVILDDKGEAQYIVIHSGGILGFGGKDIAADLTLADIRAGTEAIRLRDVTAASVRDMPEFRYDDSITSLTRSPEPRR
ncbi:MAG: PRC-barrel domain-containing protein [Alphaproteobacteria bacterium]